MGRTSPSDLTPEEWDQLQQLLLGQQAPTETMLPCATTNTDPLLHENIASATKEEFFRLVGAQTMVAMSYQVGCDRRFKEEVREVRGVDALTPINRLKLSRYRQEGTEHFGVVAQDVQEGCPSWPPAFSYPCRRRPR
jgi:hypothetical protein